MKYSSPYIIAIAGMSEGEHEFNYTVDDRFFEDYENTPVKSGKFEVDILLIKKSNHLELNFEIAGVEHTVCDRCLEDIALPIEGSQELIVKYADEEREEEEVVYINYNSVSIDISKYIYEFICLQVPMIKLCEHTLDSNCNEEVLNRLDNVYDEDIEEDEKPINPFSETLKNLKL